jgi:hypothetical protein
LSCQGFGEISMILGIATLFIWSVPPSMACTNIALSMAFRLVLMPWNAEPSFSLIRNGYLKPVC